MSEIKTFESGAVRSKDADGVRYDLISPVALRRLAEVYAEGAKKYGDNNWLKGIPSSDLLNHMQRHIGLWQQGDKTEDHLAHALWNLVALIHFSETRPDLIQQPYVAKSEERQGKLEIKAGRRYLRRDGQTTGVIENDKDPDNDEYPFIDPYHEVTYTPDGVYYKGSDDFISDEDLVREI